MRDPSSKARVRRTARQRPRARRGGSSTAHAGSLELVIERVASLSLHLLECPVHRRSLPYLAGSLAKREDFDRPRAIAQIERVVRIATPGDRFTDVRHGAPDRNRLTVVAIGVRQNLCG